MTTERLDDLMCQACEEMQLYYAYLDALEEEKRKTQPWQCEVTVIPSGADAAAPTAPAASKPSAEVKPGFACDDPE